MSFKTVRNVGLGTLLLIAVLTNVLSYKIMSRSAQLLEREITVEEAKLKAWHSLFEVIADAKDHLNAFHDGKAGVLAPVDLYIEKALKNTGQVRNLSNNDEEIAELNILTNELRGFKETVSSYMKESRKSQGDHKAVNDMDYHSLKTADNISELIRAAYDDEASRIERSDIEILSATKTARMILGTALVASVLLTIMVALIMNRALARPVNELVKATERVSEGNLTHEIKVSSNDEIGSLANALRKMTGELHKTMISKKYVENIIESVSSPFYVIDVKDYTIKLANSAAAPAGAWQNATCHALTHKSDTPCSGKDHGCPLDVVKRTKRPAVMEHIHYDSEGRQRYYDVHGYPVFNEKGDVVQMIESSIDITWHKEAEKELSEFADKLKKSNREMGEFIHIASHDLQEPMRKIMTLGSRIASKYRDRLGEQGYHYMERIQNAARKMQTLIYGLLLYSRLTSREQSFVPVDLAASANKAVSLTEVLRQQTNGEVIVGDLPVIDADPFHMQLLLQNLIANALIYHQRNTPPVVRVHGRFTDGEADGGKGGHQDKEFYRLTVEDNGEGFDEKYADRIFKVFQRLHHTDEYEGTGIGLSICRKIAENHGGSITAKSVPGEGSAFTVTLPVRHGEGPAGGVTGECP